MLSNSQVGATRSSSSAPAKSTLKIFNIHDFKSYKSFLRMLKTRTIDKDFMVRFVHFKDEEDYFRLLGIDFERIKAIAKNSGASSVQTKAESVDSTCSEIDSTSARLHSAASSADAIRNGFEHLTSFSLSVDELKITLKPLLTEKVSKEVFARLARFFYNLMSDELKEFYINGRLRESLNEPHSKSALISDEVFFKIYEECWNSNNYLTGMAATLVTDRISQDFLKTLPVTLEKIDLDYVVDGFPYLNMSSATQHLTRIKSIVFWMDDFVKPELLILPQLKVFPDCEYLEMPFSFFNRILKHLNEESNGAATELDLSKVKIQELSLKIGFQNLKKLKINTLRKDYIEGDKLIQLKLIPSLKEVEFSHYVRLWYAEKLKEFIDDTSLEKMIFDSNWDNVPFSVEIIRNPETNKFDMNEFDKMFCKDESESESEDESESESE